MTSSGMLNFRVVAEAKLEGGLSGDPVCFAVETQAKHKYELRSVRRYVAKRTAVYSLARAAEIRGAFATLAKLDVVPQLYESRYDEETCHLHVVMEYLKGVDMLHWIYSAKQMNGAERLRQWRQVKLLWAKTEQALLQSGFSHCDSGNLSNVIVVLDDKTKMPISVKYVDVDSVFPCRCRITRSATKETMSLSDSATAWPIESFYPWLAQSS